MHVCVSEYVCVSVRHCGPQSKACVFYSVIYSIFFLFHVVSLGLVLAVVAFCPFSHTFLSLINVFFHNNFHDNYPKKSEAGFFLLELPDHGEVRNGGVEPAPGWRCIFSSGNGISALCDITKCIKYDF